MLLGPGLSLARMRFLSTNVRSEEWRDCRAGPWAEAWEKDLGRWSQGSRPHWGRDLKRGSHGQPFRRHKTQLFSLLYMDQHTRPSLLFPSSFQQQQQQQQQQSWTDDGQQVKRESNVAQPHMHTTNVPSSSRTSIDDSMPSTSDFVKKLYRYDSPLLGANRIFIPQKIIFLECSKTSRFNMSCAGALRAIVSL